jgi:hypothetical protein
LAKERAAHAATERERLARLYAMLCSAARDQERALVGRAAILHHLEQLGIRQRNGLPVTWRMLRRWRRDLEFPVVRGLWRPQSRSPALSTSLAITAWLVTRFSTDEGGLWRVFDHRASQGPEGKALQELGSRAASNPDRSQTAA